MTIRTFSIRHADIMSAHITNDDEGLIIINPKWEDLDPMLKRDVIRDLKADLDSIFEDVQSEYDEGFLYKNNNNSGKDESLQEEEQSRILKLPEVLKICRISRASLYLKINEGTFPASIKLGKRSVGWIKEEIQDWIDHRIKESRSSPIP